VIRALLFFSFDLTAESEKKTVLASASTINSAPNEETVMVRASDHDPSLLTFFYLKNFFVLFLLA
jgi:hypothetical protein